MSGVTQRMAQDVTAPVASSPRPDPLFIPVPFLRVRMLPAFMVGMVAALIAFFSAGALLMRMPLYLIAFVAGMYAFGAVVFAIHAKHHARGQIRAFRKTTIEGNSEPDVIRDGMRRLLIQMVEERQLFTGREQGLWSWERLTQQRVGRGLIHVSTVAAEPLRDEMLAIERVDSMLEPEFVLSSSALKPRFSILFAGLMFFGAMLNAINGRWVGASIMAVGALFIVSSIAPIRNRIPGLRFEDRAPVAGMGVIKDHKDRRWTVDDSMMIISAKAARMPLTIFLVGPPGWAVFTFTGSQDPDFINLWQRWTHPLPRPDLLG